MRILPLIPLLCLLGACQSAPSQTPPATLAVPAAQYGRAMEAAAAALRDRGFTVERFDARMGVVSAAPEGIPTSAEAWHGNAPNLGAWEARANLQDLRHRVRLTLTPENGESKATYTLAAQAAVERLDTPTQRVTASLASPASNLAEVPEHWRSRGAQDNLWQPVGRDGDLEKKLIADVARRLRD